MCDGLEELETFKHTFMRPSAAYHAAQRGYGDAVQWRGTRRCRSRLFPRSRKDPIRVYVRAEEALRTLHSRGAWRFLDGLSIRSEIRGKGCARRSDRYGTRRCTEVDVPKTHAHLPGGLRDRHIAIESGPEHGLPLPVKRLRFVRKDFAAW